MLGLVLTLLSMHRVNGVCAVFGISTLEDNKSHPELYWKELKDSSSIHFNEECKLREVLYLYLYFIYIL